MAQRPKLIDVRKSYQPVDPASWVPQSYTNERTDSPDIVEGAIAYDGKNFMPTAYGYRSYFGTVKAWDPVLPEPAQELVFFQLDSLENIAIALCETGIYVKRADRPWVKVADEAGGTAAPLPTVEGAGLGFDPDDLSTFPLITEETIAARRAATIYQPWTYTIIENSFYAYRAGSAKVWKISSKPEIQTPIANAADFTDIREYASTGGTLPVGLYEVMYRFIFIHEASDGSLEYSYSSVGHLGTLALATPAAGFQIRLLKLDRAPRGLQLFYRVDGGASWYQKILYPPPLYDINVLWNSPGELTTDYPPTPTIVPAGEIQFLRPNFLNMAEQKGIFRAGFQLAFWDTANAIAVSSVNDLSDFTPSVETLASITTYSKILGRIVHVLPEENNFIIYATRSVIRCAHSVDVSQEWKPDSITQISGIAYPGCVTTGKTEEEHFAFTSSGIARIYRGEVEFILPDVFDVLRSKSDEVIYLKMLAGRYLFFSSTRPIFAPVIFEQEFFDPLLIQGEGSACTNLQEYASKIRASGPTMYGELALLNYYMSGKPGMYFPQGERAEYEPPIPDYPEDTALIAFPTFQVIYG